MKGLIIKDMMCLRKHRVTFIYLVTVVMIISVMYVLSASFGNIALASHALISADGVTELDVKGVSSFALILFMFLPIAMVGDVTSIFSADGKAGFVNVASALPVSVEKRVLARFITVLIFFGIGVTTDIIMAFVLTRLTDIMSFGTFLKVIIIVASMLFIYGSLICVYVLLLGYGKETYAQLCAVTTIILALIISNFSKAKMLFVSVISDTQEPLDINPVEAISTFIQDRWLSIFAIAVAVGVLSYASSVCIAKRKRGVI